MCRATVRVAAVAVLLLVVAACGEDDGNDVVAPATSEPVPTSAPSSPSTEPEATPPAPTPEVPTAEPSSASASPAAFPPDREDLEQGAETWAVVLAASTDGESPEIADAVDAAAAAGYDTGLTDCDEGAAEAVGVTDDETTPLTVSVYFDTQEDADQALAAFGAQGYDGGVVAEIATFCLD